MGAIEFSGNVNNAARVQKWMVEFWHVHERDQFWKPFTGKGMDNIIQINTDFTKEAGHQMTETLIMPLTGAGVINDEILEDNEEIPDVHTMTWTISQLRNGVRVKGKETEQQVHASLPDEAKGILSPWMAEKRDEDIWTAIAANCTKIMYVNSRAGTSSVVATDLLTLAWIQRAQTYAKAKADPLIPPLKIVMEGTKTVYKYLFVMHDDVSFDLSVSDSNYQTVAKDALLRGKTNPLLSGALMDWKGIVLFDHNNCTTASGWGAGSNVYGAESYLLGRQAAILGIGGYRINGMKSYLTWVEKRFDYKNQFGIAIGMIKGEAKTLFNSKDFSVVAVRSARTNIT